MQSKTETVCVKCGTRLPPGINFRQVKDGQDLVIGARCYNACPKREPGVERNPLCGHELRFEIQTPEGERGCVACVAVEAIDLGKMQADGVDRFWAAIGVLSSEISVDQAIAKWKAIEAVMKAAKAMRFKEAEEVGHFTVHGVDLSRLQESLRRYDEQPHVQPIEEPA